jgi:uncharacterized protein
VKGNATWESDFDICIVLDQLENGAERLIRDLVWKMGFENDRVITTIVLDSAQIEKGPMSESAIISNIFQKEIAA